MQEKNKTKNPDNYDELVKKINLKYLVQFDFNYIYAGHLTVTTILRARIFALETLLCNKGIVTKEEISNAIINELEFKLRSMEIQENKSSKNQKFKKPKTVKELEQIH